MPDDLPDDLDAALLLSSIPAESLVYIRTLAPLPLGDLVPSVRGIGRYYVLQSIPLSGLSFRS